LEVFGASGISALGINYERMLGKNALVRGNIRIGRNIPLPIKYLNSYSNLNTYPLIFNLSIGKKTVNLEIGMGWVLIYRKRDYNINYGAFTGVIGLRYQKVHGGLFGRIGFTPTIGYYGGGPGDLYVSLYGISIGYTFPNKKI
jgi:hypothetical protein